VQHIVVWNVVGRAVSISRSKEVNLNERSNDGILITNSGVWKYSVKVTYLLFYFQFSSFQHIQYMRRRWKIMIHCRSQWYLPNNNLWPIIIYFDYTVHTCIHNCELPFCNNVCQSIFLLLIGSRTIDSYYLGHVPHMLSLSQSRASQQCMGCSQTASLGWWWLHYSTSTSSQEQ